MTLLPAHAHAGSWKFSCTDGGSSASTYSKYDVFMGTPDSYSGSTPWVPPASATGTSYQIPSFGYSANSDGNLHTIGVDGTTTEDVSITAKITITWVHGTGQDDTNDPSPPSLWLIETSSAQWTAQSHSGSPGTSTVTGSGSAGDGLANPTDPVVVTTANGTKSGEVSSSANAPVQTAPPAHWFSQPVSGGVATFTRTFSAHATASLPHDGRPGSINIGAIFNGYRVQIHAQPYNFRLGPFSDPNSGKSYPSGIADDGKGQLYYHYIWDSTDGNLNDLDKCVVYEHIDNTGNSTGTYSTTASGVAQYAPVNPPFNTTVVATYDQPDPNGTNPTSGTVGYQNDVLIRPSLIKPSTAGTFTYKSTQNWLFNDSATGQTRVGLLGPLTINRTVTGSPSTSWVYTVSKSGSSASYTIP